MPFLGHVIGESYLDLAPNEPVNLHVSQLNSCQHCLPPHRPVALHAGVPPAHVAAACAETLLDELPERERAIVDWVDRVTTEPAAVDDRLLARALEWVREDELV